MIRFCDGEVGCAEYDLLSRGQLISYFLAGHMDEIVSVYDSSSTYMGIITYNSLLYSISIDAAICREYVILDNDIWDNVREIFKTRSRNFRNLTLLPVLDKDMQLICFEKRRKSVRMGRELGLAEERPAPRGVIPAAKTHRWVATATKLSRLTSWTWKPSATGPESLRKRLPAPGVSLYSTPATKAHRRPVGPENNQKKPCPGHTGYRNCPG